MSRTPTDEPFAHLSIAALRARFADRPPTRAEWTQLDQDERAGVRDLSRRLRARQEAEKEEARRFAARLSFEREHWDAGRTLVAGCDEAGVSPLAGPVVAAAVILRADDPIRGVDDSKALDPKARETLADEIRRRALCWAVGQASPEEIDALNPYHAGLLAMRRALEGLSPRPEHVLLDARIVPEFPVPQTRIVKGDALSLSIGAASILAKTHRDALMCDYDRQFPGYGFAVHKGYPVKAHVEALRKLGPCPIHRRSYTPVREAMGLVPSQERLFG